MKNILSSLNESEKKRILEMHYKSSSRQYLNEQPSTQKTTTTPQLNNREYVNEPGFPVNQYYGENGVLCTFDPETGTGTYTGYRPTNTMSTPKLQFKVTCKCDTGDGTGVFNTKFNGSEDISMQQVNNMVLSKGNISKWYTERCKLYLQDKNCGPILATRDELNALYQRATPDDIQTGDRKTICKFVKAKQGNIGMEGNSDKQKIMDKFLGNFEFYAEGTDRKTFDNISSQDFSDKGELFCKGWGL
jgi:hypothetical protein